MTRRVYIAGPMSRESFCRCDRPSARSTLPIAADPIGAGVRDAVLDSVDRWDYNYPAFTRAAATLRNLGYHVESPHEPGHVEGWAWVDYMRRGLAQMLTCDTIALLPGWHQSRGAMIELRLAEDLGMRHMLIDHDGAVVA